MSSNFSKPFQLQCIKGAGFHIPDTLVTNDPAEVLAFVHQHGRVIYKSISSARSIVREWSAKSEAELDRVRDLPTQFQAYVPGVNIRVHVVGGSLFATMIHCEGVDYRYAHQDGFDRLAATLLAAKSSARA